MQAGSLAGSGVALADGLAGALVGGLAVTLAAQTAFDRVHGVPHRDRPSFLTSRLRGLGLLVVLGTLQILSTLAAGLAGGGLGGPLATIAGVLISIAVNALLFRAAFRMLTDDSVPTRELRPGIISATILWTLLQAVGGAYINHVVRNAGAAYGTFATVIGLLTWLFLGARILLYSAELNSVLALRLLPRGLLKPQEPADRRARSIVARIEQRSDEQHVAVSFEDSDRAGTRKRSETTG